MAPLITNLFPFPRSDGKIPTKTPAKPYVAVNSNSLPVVPKITGSYVLTAANPYAAMLSALVTTCSHVPYIYIEVLGTYFLARFRNGNI